MPKQPGSRSATWKQDCGFIQAIYTIVSIVFPASFKLMVASAASKELLPTNYFFARFNWLFWVKSYQIGGCTSPWPLSIFALGVFGIAKLVKIVSSVFS